MKRISRSIVIVLLLAMTLLLFPEGRAFAAVKEPEATTIVKTANTSAGFRIYWDRVEGVDGYQIKYSESPSFENAKTAKTLTEGHTGRTLSKLEKGKNYYIRVRSFVIKANGKRRFSKWSNVVKTISFGDSLEFAGFSKIHSDRIALYYSDAVFSFGEYNEKADRKTKTVCVNAGHGTKGGSSVKTYCHPNKTAKVTGGSTAAGEYTAAAVSSGTTFLNGTPEGVVNLKVAMKVKTELLERGFNVLMIRESDDVQMDNVARTVSANNYADCHVAIHYNSTSNDAGAFYIGVPAISSYRAMYPVCDHYKDHNELGAALIKGLKGADVKVRGEGNIPLDLTQTSYSTVPSMDIEVGDRASDYSDASVAGIARGLADGIEVFFK